MKFTFWKRGNKSTKLDRATVIDRAATEALTKYEKTFKDLAAYDRGEQISLSQ